MEQGTLFSEQGGGRDCRAGRGIVRKSCSVFRALVLSFLSFLVGLHCCDDFTGCRGDGNVRKISPFCRECFIVVCIYALVPRRGCIRTDL